MTILGGNYEPVEVKTLDLVGYKGDGVFAILNPIRSMGRKLPDADTTQSPHIPVCIRAKIVNNQVINFGGKVATLNDIDGVWHYTFRDPKRQPIELDPYTFFEIGSD
jgi:hypothetical protein